MASRLVSKDPRPSGTETKTMRCPKRETRASQIRSSSPLTSRPGSKKVTNQSTSTNQVSRSSEAKTFNNLRPFIADLSEPCGQRNFGLYTDFWRCSFTSPFHKYQKHAAAQLEKILSLQTILTSCASSDQLWKSESNGMDHRQLYMDIYLIHWAAFYSSSKNSMKHTLRWMSINVFKINPNGKLHW